MCKYCESDEYLIGNDYDYNDSLMIKDATLIMSSYRIDNYGRDCETINKKPINYCPMCGRDLVEAFLDKLRQERQYD